MSGQATRPVEQAGALPLLAALAIVSLLIPAQFWAGTLILNASRVLFLVTIVPLSIRLFSGAYGRLILPDYLIFLFIGWILLSLGFNHPDRLVGFGGSQAVMVLGPYLIARATIRTPETFLKVMCFLSICVVVLLPFTLVESVLGRNIPLQFFEGIPGLHTPGLANSEPRMGLYRAQTVFPHPIHFGLFSGLTFSILFVAAQRVLGGFTRIMLCLLLVFSVFFSLSSGPLLTVLVQLILVAWWYFTRGLQGTWLILIALTTVIYIVIEVLSDRSAFVAILSRLTFNSHNLYFRAILFEEGIEEIVKRPIFGLGFEEWDKPAWMVASVDNHWLLLATTYGVPAFLVLFIAMTQPIIRIARKDFGMAPSVHLVRIGWSIAVVSIILSMFTVALFGVIYSLTIFVFASGLWLVHFRPETGEPEQKDLSAPATTVRTYSRFPVSHASGRAASEVTAANLRPNGGGAYRQTAVRRLS